MRDYIHLEGTRLEKRLQSASQVVAGSLFVKSLSVTNLSSENNLLTLRLNAPVVIRVKVSASYFPS